MSTIDCSAFANMPTTVPLVGTTEDDDLAGLRQTLDQALAKDQPETDALGEIAQALLRVPGISAGAFFASDSASSQGLPTTALFCRHPQQAFSGPWKKTLDEVAAEAIRTTCLATATIRQANTRLLAVASPIQVADQTVGAVGVISETAASRKQLASSLNLVTQKLSRWRSNPDRSQPAEPKCMDDGLVNGVLAQPDLTAAAQRVAEHIKNRYGFSQVLIGKGINGRRCRLLVNTDSPVFSKKSPLTMAAEETLSEAIIRGQSAWTDVRGTAETVTAGIRELALLCNAQVIASGSIALVDETPWGAWVAVRQDLTTAEILPQVDQCTRSVARCLMLFGQAEGSRISRFCRRLRKFLMTRRSWLVIAILLLLAMLVPLPYYVKSDCELQPVTRRFVPVPYDGVLQQVFVEPGDEIRAGQFLAKMDGREIKWELAALQAEYGRAAKQHDSDLVKRDAAAAQVTQLEMERLQVQIELLKNRLQNLEIKSSIDGVIIGGDPKKKEAARLSQGENLFEAGPLSRMIAEIFVPDDEVARVQEGQRAAIRLEAFPSRKWSGIIGRLSPSAEVRDQKNVFVAEFEIDNPQHVLRPGMRGRSRIRTSLRPLGWNLFHKAWEQLVYGWGW